MWKAGAAQRDGNAKVEDWSIEVFEGKAWQLCQSPDWSR